MKEIRTNLFIVRCNQNKANEHQERTQDAGLEGGLQKREGHSIG